MDDDSEFNIQFQVIEQYQYRWSLSPEVSVIAGVKQRPQRSVS
jgi:hypothetical protein